MLSCHDIAHKHASDYIDGQLSWRGHLAVWSHLLICVKCRRFVNQLRLVCKVVLKRQEPDLPAENTIDLDELAHRLHTEHLEQKKMSPDL